MGRPISEEIESLRQLRERGVLSAEEFEKAKNRAIQTSMLAHKTRAGLPSYTKLAWALVASIVLAILVVVLLGPR